MFRQRQPDSPGVGWHGPRAGRVDLTDTLHYALCMPSPPWAEAAEASPLPGTEDPPPPGGQAAAGLRAGGGEQRATEKVSSEQQAGRQGDHLVTLKGKRIHFAPHDTAARTVWTFAPHTAPAECWDPWPGISDTPRHKAQGTKRCFLNGSPEASTSVLPPCNDHETASQTTHAWLVNLHPPEMETKLSLCYNS